MVNKLRDGAEKSLLTFDHQNRAKIRNKFSFVTVARRWRLVSLSYHLSLKAKTSISVSRI